MEPPELKARFLLASHFILQVKERRHLWAATCLLAIILLTLYWANDLEMGMDTLAFSR